MKRLSCPALHDVVRILGSSEDEVFEKLKGFFLGSPPFNYRVARSVIPLLMTGAMRLPAALQACRSMGSPVGAECNAQVIELAYEWAQQRNVRFYPLVQKDLWLRPDFSIPAKLDGYYVYNDIPYLFWTQPRKYFSPDEQALAILATCYKMLFAVEDFERARLTILDLSARTGTSERVVRTYGFGDLSLVTFDALRTHLTRFAKAFDALAASGFAKPERKPKKRDKRQGDLF